jgi:hypothetical protein
MVQYIDPADSFEWKRNRNKFENQIQIWCLDHAIDFFGTYSAVVPGKSDKIVKLTIFELVLGNPELMALNLTLRQCNKHLFYITDNLLDYSKLQEFDHITFVSIPELFGIISLYQIQPNTSPSRLYNCFIQRVDPTRQSWFYFLHHHDLLDKGYVTFLLSQVDWYADCKTGLELYDWIHDKHSLNQIEHFDRAYHELRSKVPYRNFDLTTSLYEYANDCKYSLVLETYATRDDSAAFCFTEKTHRALQTPTINLFFSQKNSLTHLVQLGFRIPDVMLEIDTCSWQARQQALLEILVNDPIEFDHENQYNDAIHNRELIRQYKTEFIKGDFLEKILTEIKEA